MPYAKKEETQKDEMRALFNEIRERLRNYEDTEKPKEFFKFIGERMRSQNINELKFANFMVKEAEKSLRGDLGKSFSAFIGMLGAGEVGKGEKPGLGSMIWDSMINNSLVMVAECIKEANSKKMTLSELTEGKSDYELKRLTGNKISIAREWRKKVLEGEKEAELSHLDSEGEFRAETKMRKELEKQQGKMRKLFNELETFATGNINWYQYENPNGFEFLRKISNKLKAAGIDEGMFADFVMSETEKELRASVRGVREESPEIEFGRHFHDERMARCLVFFAECVKGAALENLGVSEFFEEYKGRWVRKQQMYERKTQEWIQKFRDGEE